VLNEKCQKPEKILFKMWDAKFVESCSSEHVYLLGGPTKVKPTYIFVCKI